MNHNATQWLRPLLFALGGAGLGLLWYGWVGCTTGSCPITANPISSMAYMGLMGLLLSSLFQKEGEDECSM